MSDIDYQLNAEKLLKLLRRAGFHLGTDSKRELFAWLEQQPAETSLIVLLVSMARTNPVWLSEIEYWVMVSVNDDDAAQYANRIITAEIKRSEAVTSAWTEFAHAIAKPLERALVMLNSQYV